jgi:hypothetical protein
MESVAALTIYVYRVNDREFGAGFGESGCRKRGEIVEKWPINTPSDARFVASHGTAYWKTYDQVSKLANIAFELLTSDPTFTEEPAKPAIAAQAQISAPKPSRWAWLAWFRRTREAT